MKILLASIVVIITLAYSATLHAADSNIRYKDMPVSPPSVPNMSSSGAYSDICVVARAGGVSGGFIGISAGIQVVDKNCERIKLSRALAQLGLKVSATAMLCQDMRVFKSMKDAGSPCPVDGLIGDAALKRWKELGVINENNEVVSHSDVLLVNGRKPRRNNDYGQPTQ